MLGLSAGRVLPPAASVYGIPDPTRGAFPKTGVMLPGLMVKLVPGTPPKLTYGIALAMGCSCHTGLRNNILA